MKNDTDITGALEAWQTGQKDISGAGGAGQHLSDETLYQLAVRGGLQNGSPDDLEHLSLCPTCLAGWVEWQESISLADGEDVAEESVMTHGFLKAAATMHLKGPLRLQSSCERFLLSVYPDREDKDAGLVTLEVSGVGVAGQFEGRRFAARDAKGSRLVTGTMREGRLAGRLENPGSFDFSAWTLVEFEPGDMGQDTP